MHIVLALLSLVGVIAVWYWRLKMLREAGREAKKVAETAVNLPRRLKFRHRTSRTGLAVVADPREAACIMMVTVAQAAGALSDGHRAAIKANILRHFKVQDRDAEDMIEQAVWFSRSGNRPEGVMRKMAAYIRPMLREQEQADLAEMLEDVALVEGEPNDEQVFLIGIYLKAVGLNLG
jgi:uncharacterized tellurite resistance protein B-like protein